MKNIQTFRIIALFLFVLSVMVSCKFKQKAEARIKGDGGEIVLEVEVVSGAEFKTKGMINPGDCEQLGIGTPIKIASCDVLANVTRKVKKEDGTEEVETRRETHTLDYWVACIPGTEWEVDCSDPIIMQVPQDWKVEEATFDSDNRTGYLTVEETIPMADHFGTPYQAEPGNKLIVLGFPYGTPEDTYQIGLRFSYVQPGLRMIKAIFAAAVRVFDPVTGELQMFYPPAIPAVRDFALVQDPFFIAEVTGAKVAARPLSDQEAALALLPETDKRTYVVLSSEGGDPASIDADDLTLRIE